MGTSRRPWLSGPAAVADDVVLIEEMRLVVSSPKGRTRTGEGGEVVDLGGRRVG